MKIYTRTVCQWQPDGSLKLVEDDSFDYEGPVTLCKDAPSPPPAPDYKGAAQATAASQKVSQYTPYGNLVYSQTGVDSQGNPTWRSDVSLAPQAQQTLDTQLGLSQKMGDITNAQVPRVQAQYGQPIDLSSVPDIANKAYSAMTSRLDPQWQQAEEQTHNRLINQGLTPGTQAYDNAMREFNQAKNDAYQQANLGAIQTMPQTYQLSTSTYNQPLNILNALRTGAQIQNPQFQPAPAATNYLGAAQAAGNYAGDIYNQQVAQQNSMMGGLFNLGGSLGAAGVMKYGLPFLA